jgi:beta-xylosidase
LGNSLGAQNRTQNPIIHANVPDMSMIRVGDTYYMSSTTMHISRGVSIMKSKDLVNWEIVNYCYDMLDDVDALNLEKGKNAYDSGSWASTSVTTTILTT